MSIIAFLILGLIAGALGKLLMPGKDGGGIFMTMLLGIAGSFIGGFIGRALNFGGDSALSWQSIVTATIGAVILLFIFRLIKSKKK